MSWFLVGGTALTVVSSAYGQEQQKKKVEKDVVAENNRRAAANLKNAVRAGYRQGILNVQQGQYKQLAARQGFDLDTGKKEALGQVNANAAAAGTVGASVDAVANDIEMKVGQQELDMAANFDLSMRNFDMQRSELAFAAEQGEFEMLEADTPSSGEIWQNAALAGVGYAARTYMGQRQKLGPGGKSGGSDRAALQQASTQYKWD